MSTHEIYEHNANSLRYQIINEEDDSSISMDGDFCLVNPNEIQSIPKDAGLSHRPIAANSNNGHELTYRSRRAGKPPKPDDMTKEKNSHANPAFVDDDGLGNVKGQVWSDDYGRERDLGAVTAFNKKIGGDIIAGSDIELLEVKSRMEVSVTKVSIQPNVSQDTGSNHGRHPALRHIHRSKRGDTKGSEDQTIPKVIADNDEREEQETEQNSKEQDTENSPHLSKKAIRINFAENAAPKGQVFDEDKGRQSTKPSLQPTARPRRTGEESRPGRAVRSRSISSFAFKLPTEDLKMAASLAVPRSQSMRVASSSGAKGKSRKLLRDLSFSDADAQTIRNYGALRGSHSIPRRIQRQANKENEIAEGCEDAETKVTPEIKEHLVDLMHELVGRGKVHHIAVFDQDNATILACLPAVWDLDSREIMGVVKAVKWTQQPMLKLHFEKEMYTCFKHGQSKLVGRAGNSVLVVQLTDTCAVVGISDDDTPGSCHYEVSELTQALADKGW